MMKLPRARVTNIVIQSLGKETLIYDLLTYKAFNLNETSSIVYQACGDGLTFDELKRKSEFTDEIIYLALDELKKERLIEESAGYSSPFAGMSRREVIRKAGLASMIALPVISSLVAPTTAQAQSLSNLALGQTCTAPSQCSSGAPNCAARTSNGTRRCCIGSVSYYDTGGVVNACSGGACGSATFACQANAGSFCCSGAATATCTGNSCACTCL